MTERNKPQKENWILRLLCIAYRAIDDFLLESGLFFLIVTLFDNSPVKYFLFIYGLIILLDGIICFLPKVNLKPDFIKKQSGFLHKAFIGKKLRVAIIVLWVADTTVLSLMTMQNAVFLTSLLLDSLVFGILFWYVNYIYKLMQKSRISTVFHMKRMARKGKIHSFGINLDFWCICRIYFKASCAFVLTAAYNDSINLQNNDLFYALGYLLTAISLFSIMVCWMYHLSIVLTLREANQAPAVFPWASFVLIIIYFVSQGILFIVNGKSILIIVCLFWVLSGICLAFYKFAKSMDPCESQSGAKVISCVVGWLSIIASAFMGIGAYSPPELSFEIILRSGVFVLSGALICCISGTLLNIYTFMDRFYAKESSG